jgi:hypothetical protein
MAWTLPQTVCMVITSSLYVGYKPFVCGLQAFCMRVTNRLYGHYKQFVCGLQIFVCGVIGGDILAV